ncbi:MAG: AAA family ATPase [Chlorobium sp.]
MKKEFNDTGTCIASGHYMVDTSNKIAESLDLINRGKYFIINRPRQYGKTTTLYLLEEKLKKLDDYLPIKISFEGIGDTAFRSQEEFCPFFLEYLAEEFYVKKLGLSSIFTSRITNGMTNFKALSSAITDICTELGKKVVLMIDEVDKSSNNQLFLHFLGMLRDKYLKTSEGRDTSFYSVVLAGVHDVKTLKLKLRPDEEAKYNSPWNIAVDYKVDLSFSAKEIETMLTDFVNCTKTEMNIPQIAEELFFYTNGYPYFVSKLCKIIDEEIKPEKWEKEVVVEAIKILMVTKNNTNFDNVIKNLENNPGLSNLVEKIILGNAEISYDPSIPLVNLGEIHGILTCSNKNKVKIFNKIIEEKISNYLIGKIETEGRSVNTTQSIHLKPDGRLDMKKVLLKFQEVIEEKYSKSDLMKSSEFLENDLRMLFLVFLKPIINGTGFSFKEAQTSAERRLDVVVLFNDEKFIVELKMWYGEEYHLQGIEQIKDYMQREHCQEGYMIVMSKKLDKKFISTDENGIFTIWL